MKWDRGCRAVSVDVNRQWFYRPVNKSWVKSCDDKCVFQRAMVHKVA
jgi:hypothetical protein